MKKIEQALLVCESVLEGIENNTLLTSSVLLQCLKIARLLNDTESISWLQYEYGGYPRDEKGYIKESAWNIGYKHGRGYLYEGKKIIFLELASELEGKIDSQKKAINNYSTKGASVSGDQAYGAMNVLTGTVSKSTSGLLSNIAVNEKRLAILKSEYYDYALRKSIELSFSNVVTDVFSIYREQVDNYFNELSSETILKLQAIQDKINSDNPEMYSQALTTCRRLLENTAEELFDKHFPNYTEKMYKTKSGKEIDVSGDHYLNKLSAVVERLQNKSLEKTLVGSNIKYMIDWIKNLSELQCKGVHSEITKEEAMRCIIHTYICLGDILSLQE